MTEHENPMGTDGFEFVEYTAPDPKLLGALFEQMGFTPVARHRSKDVLLYRQGRINFIVNREPDSFAQSFARVHGPSACAFAMRVKDAAKAYKRPDALLEALAGEADVAERGQLERAARQGMDHHRVARIDGAERASSGQARCRHCHELIERRAWRIRLVLHEEGNFPGGGFVHLHCRRAYFEVDDILEQVLHFSRGLGAEERAALAGEFDRSPP